MAWLDRRRHQAVMLGAAFGLVATLVLAGRVLALLPAPIGPAARQFADGALTTIELTLVSGAAGLLLGLGLALGKLSTFLPLRWLCQFVIWVLRGTPLLLQVLFFFLAVPAVVPAWQLSEFTTAAVALALNVGAYNAEVIRAGLLSVPKGQIEAARALALGRFHTFVDVVFPQGMRVSLPPLANNVVALLKDSSLAYAIGVVELTMVSNRVQAESFQPVPVFLTVAALYLVLTTAFTQFAAALERQMAKGH